MATGPEHYRQAEQFLAASTLGYQNWAAEQDAADLASAQWQLAQAQVHATLALAATIGVGMPLFVGGEAAMPIADSDAWVEAASEATGNKGDAR